MGNSNSSNGIYIAYGMAWIATSVAISVAIYTTGSGWALFGLLLPASIKISVGK